MKSAWFWGTEMWHKYIEEYAEHHSECLHEWKSSPLANDHDFYGMSEQFGCDGYRTENHLTQVIELHLHQWSNIRKSYHSIIHRAEERYKFEILPACDFPIYKQIHILANGFQPRNDATYALQEQWIKDGYGLMVGAIDRETDNCVAVAYWILYNGHAYYASGPSTEANIMHAVIWHSLKFLKLRGVHLVELGQIDGATEKERNIGKFKVGFGGEPMPFTIVRKIK